VDVDFASSNRIEKVRATNDVSFQQAAPQQTATLHSEEATFFMRPDGSIDRVITPGQAQLVISSLTGNRTKTEARAAKLEADFAARNQLKVVRGEGSVQVVASEPGRPERKTSSDSVIARFDAGNVTSLEQNGNFQYSEAARNITADRATFAPAADVITIAGSPRLRDKDAGLALSAQAMRLNRRTGEAAADGEVKGSYTQMRPSGGAMLAGSEPVHVTAQAAVASRDGRGRFTGSARLWQGANIVQAPVIEFDRARRSLAASVPRGATGRVQTSFVQIDSDGRQVPVNVTAGKLTYSDADRRAVFEGVVHVRSPIATISAQRVEVVLRPAGQLPATKQSASQVQSITASGNLVIEQRNPARKAFGEKLVYTASDGKFELSGKPGQLPSIFDAELGNITGDSLTFHSRDDKVQVKSGQNSRTVTQTHIKDHTRP
jgi:lipopolysaccharide export system protein LptA